MPDSPAAGDPALATPGQRANEVHEFVRPRRPQPRVRPATDSQATPPAQQGIEQAAQPAGQERLDAEYVSEPQLPPRPSAPPLPASGQPAAAPPPPAPPAPQAERAGAQPPSRPMSEWTPEDLAARWLALYGPEETEQEVTAHEVPEEPEPIEPAPAIAPDRPPRRPEPVPDPTRRFLRPLVGIDPRDVPVYRDPEADRRAQALNADALATEHGIELGAGQHFDAPETQGLLAHELVHVARRRDRTFVPPVRRQGAATGRLRALPANGAGPEPERDAPSETDEETLALQTEADVTRIARARTPATGQVAPEPALPRRAGPDEDWGGLPAPWEPLPEGLFDHSEPAPQASTSPPPAIAPLPPPVVAPVRPAPIQRAAADRPRVESPAGPAANPAETERQVEPDLDRLARDVYAVLKRRIAAERRRSG